MYFLHLQIVVINGDLENCIPCSTLNEFLIVAVGQEGKYDRGFIKNHEFVNFGNTLQLKTKILHCSCVTTSSL